MRLHLYGMERLARVRDGFLIVDFVLKDTLLDYARGTVDEEHVFLALQRHRETYEDYLQGMYELLVPIPEA